MQTAVKDEKRAEDEAAQSEAEHDLAMDDSPEDKEELAQRVIDLAVELETHARRLLITHLPNGSKAQVVLKADRNVQLRVRGRLASGHKTGMLTGTMATGRAGAETRGQGACFGGRPGERGVRRAEGRRVARQHVRGPQRRASWPFAPGRAVEPPRAACRQPQAPEQSRAAARRRRRR
jgi:hypothetical protein